MSDTISIRGSRVHNLKNVSLDIPKNTLTVFTGLSGSGKSSLAFDTIAVEGQRRYVESLSAYARQFLELRDRPDVDEISGLSPTIAIDQRTVSRNPRSTVGTITEVSDYLRLLFARMGEPHCHRCGTLALKQTVETIRDQIIRAAGNRNGLLLAPAVRSARGEHRHILEEIRRAGYAHVRHDGHIISVEEALDQSPERGKYHTIEAVVVRLGRSEDAPTVEALKKALELSGGHLIFVAPDDAETLLSTKLACHRCGLSLPEVEPRLFSFNSPQGACPACTGLGMTLTFDPELVLPNPRLTIAEGAIRPLQRLSGNHTAFMALLGAVAARHNFSLNQPISELSARARGILLGGTKDETHDVSGHALPFPGVIAHLMSRYRETDSDYLRKELEAFMRENVCDACAGKRLRPEALAVTISGKSIADWGMLPISELLPVLEQLAAGKNGRVKNAGAMDPVRGRPPSARDGLRPRQMSGSASNGMEEKVARPIAREVMARLGNLAEVGLEYLAVDRSAATLSGGEAQRVRLGTQLAAGLSGLIYVLDEPTIGLHQRDIGKLIATLKGLRDGGNTVIVVEHDATTIRAADYVFDIGPGAGIYGGEVVASGRPNELARSPRSLTGKYLSGRLRIEPRKVLRRGNGKGLVVVGATEHNLQNIDVRIPLGTFICVSGVSGSGKSTLVQDILARALSMRLHGGKELPGKHKEIRGIEHLDKAIAVDQSPIGRTPRSNPATYTGLFTAIRDLFTEVPEARVRGFDAGKFSFNVKGGGRCEPCAGEGYIEIPMQFLPDVYVECSECHGKRYNAEALEVRFRGKTIADVLAMTVEEALKFFHDIPPIAIGEKLTVLRDVGLGYLRLGQPATNLSGGEAQRVKLAAELGRRETGRTLYILDEPTVGLHFDDIRKLLDVLHRLVERGNTVLVVEHNMDVIGSADWVIDLGPDGGTRGGKVVAAGTPAEVARAAKSVTGKYLREVLKSGGAPGRLAAKQPKRVVTVKK
ncbi:MAG: excinuclease ABC subunit UvrA [Patescibacteria group bacterium]